MPTLHEIDNIKHQAKDNWHEVVALGTRAVLVYQKGLTPRVCLMFNMTICCIEEAEDQEK